MGKTSFHRITSYVKPGFEDWRAYPFYHMRGRSKVA